MAAIFQPTLLDWLWGSGIGTNVGASILWGFLAGLLGYVVQKKVRSAWERHKKQTAEHEEWTARHLARLMHRHGVEVDAHPHHDV